jgi:glycosyltransferase involved in cell wall biosynthesis
MLEPLYDVETAIRAFAKVRLQHPDARLVIVGAGSDERRLREIVAKEEILSVEFSGRVERNKIADLFDEADIVLNTSVIDNMPVAIIEAFYCGVPVVTTDAGGIPYFVENDVSGLVVPMRDVNAVAAALARVMNDGACRMRLIEGGRVASKLFSWEAVRQKWADLYTDLAGSYE